MANKCAPQGRRLLATIGDARPETHEMQHPLGTSSAHVRFPSPLPDIFPGFPLGR